MGPFLATCSSDIMKPLEERLTSLGRTKDGENPSKLTCASHPNTSPKYHPAPPEKE